MGKTKSGPSKQAMLRLHDPGEFNLEIGFIPRAWDQGS